MEQFVEPIKLESRHLKNCTVLPDRYAILSKMPKNSIVAEIGVLAGDFSEHIIRTTEPSQLYLVDTFNIGDWNSSTNKRFDAFNHYEFVANRFKTSAVKTEVVLKQGISWEVMSQFPENYFDWIYVDADHRYSGVSNDLKEAIRTLKPEGYIVMNDYIFYSHLESMPYGVIHAVNEVCVKFEFEIVYLALHPQMYCDVVIKRIS